MNAKTGEEIQVVLNIKGQIRSCRSMEKDEIFGGQVREEDQLEKETTEMEKLPGAGPPTFSVVFSCHIHQNFSPKPTTTDPRFSVVIGFGVRMW